MYLSIERKGQVKKILKNWPEKDVRFICVTNGGRILGLGDLGANGMPIPIGKLQLYTAAAGVPPKHLLPLYLDSGTNNEALLHDPMYLGARRARASAEELVSFVDEFVEAVQQVFPHCCLHFEDWTGKDAVHLLERYRNQVCCYNDDIQGTASITLAGLINAMKIKKEKLSDQKILFLGAGSAGIGIANLIVKAMTSEGLSEDSARKRLAFFDLNGLIEHSRQDLFDFQRPYAHKLKPTKDFVEAIKQTQATTIIGVSTKGGTFTQQVVETMASQQTSPVIFALSNPTDHAECTAEQAYKWSSGRAIYAAGVQFDPVTIQGHTKLPGQANNFYIFPAVGLAVFVTGAKRITDKMFIEAAHAVADLVTNEQLAQGLLFPLQSNILEAEIQTAVRVANCIFEENLAQVPKPKDMESFIRKHLFIPEYYRN